MALRIMRLSEVKAVTGLSKTTIYRFEKQGRFPSRVSLGESEAWAGLRMMCRHCFVIEAVT